VSVSVSKMVMAPLQSPTARHDTPFSFPSLPSSVIIVVFMLRRVIGNLLTSATLGKGRGGGQVIVIVTSILMSGEKNHIEN
jgi:hypothetical protein